MPGTLVYNNVIWGFNPSLDVNGIRTAFYQNDGTTPIQIYNNTVWVTGTAFVQFRSAGSTGPSVQYTNNLSVDGSQGSTTISAGNFVGPIPTVNTQGTADAGDGPGSAFIPISSATNIVGQATGTTASTDITAVSRPQGGSSDRGAYELIP